MALSGSERGASQFKTVGHFGLKQIYLNWNLEIASQESLKWIRVLKYNYNIYYIDKNSDGTCILFFIEEFNDRKLVRYNRINEHGCSEPPDATIMEFDANGLYNGGTRGYCFPKRFGGDCDGTPRFCDHCKFKCLGQEVAGTFTENVWFIADF